MNTRTNRLSLTTHLRTAVIAGLSYGLTTLGHATELDVTIHYLKLRPPQPKVLSDLVRVPGDNGEQGARLGIADNNTTGRFLKQKYALQARVVETGSDPVPAAKEMLDGGPRLAVLDVPADALRRIAALPEAQDDLLFNAGASRTALRNDQCMANVLHTLPSRAMRSDALMQFLVRKKWTKIFLVSGTRPSDKAWADALRQSIRKFRLTLVDDKPWPADADVRRTAASEVPALTQARAYDVVMVADEARDFSPFLQYNTWLPRPVVGSAGLRPVTWDRVLEQWGARQLQSRFGKQSQRAMTGRDYAAWSAVRAVGEAVTRTQTAKPADIRQHLLSDGFSLGGFKRTSLSFRGWNGQMRQAIPLVSPDAVVEMAPVAGFLHKVTELDTLGIDRGESACQRF